MRTFFTLLCLANIAFAFGSLPWMPEEIGVHFALDGTVNRYAPPMTSAVTNCLMVVFMGSVILGTSLLTPIIPSKHWNIPNRDYWLNEENRPKTIRRFQSFIEMIGAGTMFCILLTHVELFRANLTVPPTKPNIAVSLCAFGILMAVITFESIRLLCSYGFPQEKRQLDESAIPTTMTPNEKPKGDDQ